MISFKTEEPKLIDRAIVQDAVKEMFADACWESHGVCHIIVQVLDRNQVKKNEQARLLLQ